MPADSNPSLVDILNKRTDSNAEKYPVLVSMLENTKSVKQAKSKTRRHHVAHCAAINCKNNKYDNPEMSFFRFPKDEERCRQWVINSRRKDIVGKSSAQLYNGSVLCAAHFEDSQFSSSKKNYLKKKQAIPTIFDVPNPPKKLTPSRPAPKRRQLTSKPNKSLNELDDNQSNRMNDLTPAPKRRQLLSKSKKSTDEVDDNVSNLRNELTPSLSAPNPRNILSKSKNSINKSRSHSAVSDTKTSSSFKEPMVNHVKRIADLKRKLNAQRMRLNRLEKAKSRKPTCPKKEIEMIKDMSSKYLSKDSHNFFCKQLECSVNKGNKWSANDKSFALSLYDVSPKAYSLLQKQFHLPSTETLKRERRKL